MTSDVTDLDPLGRPTDLEQAGDGASTSSPGPGSHGDVEVTGQRRAFWERFLDGRRPEGQDLAALRRGIGREPGSVPAMWPYYTTLTADGRKSPALLAEHHALTLFAVHQQSQPALVHRPGVGLGEAVRALKWSGTASEDAVDRRFSAAATATSLSELAVHVRGLVTQLRGIRQPLDYTRLAKDLRAWHSSDGAAGVRRRWGGEYFAPAKATTEPSTQKKPR